MNPLISVVIPIYHVEAYLDRCIQSVVDQTYRDIEIILVDDGSPDNCPAMCDAWAEKDDRIHVIHQKNGGLSAARNAGLDAMTGEYVAFVDSDDAVCPTFIEALYRGIIRQKTMLALCGICVIQNDKDVKPVKPGLPAVIDKTYVFNRTGTPSDINVLFSVAWNKLYHRSLFTCIRFPVGKIHEDEYIMHHIIHQADKIAIAADPLYLYYRRDDSIMGNSNQKFDLELELALFDRYQFLEQHYPDISTRAFGDLILRWAEENRGAAASQEQIRALDAFLYDAAKFHCKAQGLSLHDPSVSDIFMRTWPRYSLKGFLYRLVHKLQRI